MVTIEKFRKKLRKVWTEPENALGNECERKAGTESGIELETTPKKTVARRIRNRVQE
jgi:hypothetical protein